MFGESLIYAHTVYFPWISSLSPHTALRDRSYYDAHFLNEETGSWSLNKIKQRQKA